MSGRPVRRRVLADIERLGGWSAVLERIARGETVTEIARSFTVSRSFFARLLHEDRDRHGLVCQAREAAADAFEREVLQLVEDADLVDDERKGDEGLSEVEADIGRLHLAPLLAPCPSVQGGPAGGGEERAEQASGCETPKARR